jgi:hypothetical protein
LDEAAAEGYDCLAVARPEPELVQQGVAVVLGRASAGGSSTLVAVMTARRHRLRAMELRRRVHRRSKDGGPPRGGGLEGFCPVAASQLADNRVPQMRSWIVVSERPANGGSPIETVFRSAPGPDGLQKALTEQAGKGFRVGLLWKESASIVALSGAYLGDFSYLSGGDRVVVREKSITASTMVVENRLPALGTPGYAAVHPSCARCSRGLVARRA